MKYTISDKKLIICDGESEIGYRDVCDVISSHDIREVFLPESIKIIHDHTFFDFPEIDRVNIPEGVRYIGAQAFWGLDNLEKLTLPITVPFIGKHAFCNCRKLELLIFGKARDLPSGWDSEFAANINRICYLEADD